MTLLNRIARALLLSFAVSSLLLLVSTTFSAQTKVPARTSHINDFPGVIDELTKRRLDGILENLERRAGIQFDVATIQTTAGQEIFEFSRQLAREWDIGARNTAKKSLLLVISVDEKNAFTQFSRTVQNDLPEGVLGEIAQGLRALLSAGQFSTGVTYAVEHFATAMGNKLAFKLADLDPHPAQPDASETSATLVSVNQPSPDVSPPANAYASGLTRRRQVTVTPTPTPEPEARPTVVPETVTPTPTPEPEARPTVVPETVTPTPTPEPEVARQTTVPAVVTLSADDAEDAEEVELTLTLPLAERAAKLKAFLEEHPNSKARTRATELLVSTHAALGDQLLGNRDIAGGTEQLMLAIEEAPVDASEKLYSGVIAQIPLNLYLRNERAAAFKAAQNIEAKFGGDSRRLLGLASFYLGIERGDEAARLAAKAVSLTPESAEAHYSLGLGLHISLRLDEAAAEYKRAIELDPNLRAAHRSLADLNRATGKSEEALALYRDQLRADPNDKLARAGIVISLFDAGHMEEGDKELEAALQEDPRNVSLLTGAAYWFAAHNNTRRGLELAGKAVEIEPRYTWSQIALARSLVGEKRPLEAERALRFARQYGKFATLDYELASVLAAAGLFDEAADALRQTFQLVDGEIETQLAGRTPARANNFIDLLAPERRAGLFQFSAADTEENAKRLKSLLAFALLADTENADEKSLTAAAKEFAAGEDSMRAYRQLYAANRLMRMNRSLDTVGELVEAAKGGVDDALGVPAVTVAVQAEELREIRARAIAGGGTPDIPEAPRNVLGNILRGRIEDLSGWRLFYQDKPAEAVDHLRRAVNVLPEGTPSWRTASWHLGAALEADGKKEEALAAYIKSYAAGPDPSKRALIEKLYVQVNGSTTGLEEKLGNSSGVSPTNEPAANPTTEPAQEPSVAAVAPDVTAANKPTGETTAPSGTELPAVPTPSPAAPDAEAAKPEPTPTETPLPETPKTGEPTTSPSPEPKPAEQGTETAAPAKQETQRAPSSSEPSLSDLPANPPAKPRTSLKLTGRVKDAAGSPIANVVVVLISPHGSVLASTTDAEGNYTFTVSPSERPFRLLPSKEGFIFEPLDKSLLMIADDQTAVDFVGTPARNPQN